jgi:hypothetical protein
MGTMTSVRTKRESGASWVEREWCGQVGETASPIRRASEKK